MLKQKIIILIIIVMLFCYNFLIFSQPCPVPHIFSSGSVISASELNDNFSALCDRTLDSIVDVDAITDLTIGSILEWDGVNWSVANDLSWQRDMTLDGNLIVHGGTYILGGDGDVNDDGICNLTDSLLVYQYLSGLTDLTELQYLRADVNGDLRVTITDRDFIARYHVGLYTMDEIHHSVGKRIIDRTIGVTDTGNVGIGELEPQQKLDVAGTVRAQGLIIEGGSYTLGGNGDINNDGSTDNIDGLIVAEYVGGNRQLTPDEYSIADINGDGKVTMTDSLLINMIYVNLITIDEANHSVGKHMTDSAISIFEEGNVGIGILGPQRKLHVNDVMRLEPRDTEPAVPSAGDLYFDSTSNKLRCYDGSTWQDCF